jgi:uncharacterized protein YndB with AHSA1/START domain
MTTMTAESVDTPVRKSITVRARIDDAFRIFTEDMDSWWPRSHHIGKSPMKKIIVEGRTGGRCYTEQVDGTDCDWGSMLVWEPPRRFVFAWQITHEWHYQPDVALSSEVEVRFTPVGPDSTRVDLEHRYLNRHGPGGPAMRASIDAPDGWMGLLRLYAARVNQSTSANT